jgi:hypothetical protein
MVVPPLSALSAFPSTMQPLQTMPPLLFTFVRNQPTKPNLNYASFEAAKRGAAKFLCKVVDEVWYNDLKEANTFYTKVMAREIFALLDANSGGLHAIDMISLRTNMHNYYTQADGIPQYINMLGDVQKKATRAGMPIANVEL